MKKLILIFFATILASNLLAQTNNNVRSFEFEAGMGLNKGNKYNGVKAEVGGQFFTEARLNLKNSPYDVGIQFALGVFDRKETPTYPCTSNIRYKPTFMALVDYNFRKWKNVSLFGGIGLGSAFIDHEYDYSTSGYNDDTVFTRSLLLTPRVGVEFFNHIRITMEYKMMKQEYSHLGVNVGIVFGGGKKK